MELLNQLGIDWRLLIAQLVNFSVLLFILHRFLYKPVLSMLEKRRVQIEENDKKTELLTKRIDEAEQASAQKMSDARRQAQNIVTEAEEEVRKLKEETSEHLRDETQKMLATARAQAEQERERVFADIQKEGTVLIKESVRKVLGAVTDEKTATALYEKAAAHMKDMPRDSA